MKLLSGVKRFNLLWNSGVAVAIGVLYIFHFNHSASDLESRKSITKSCELGVAYLKLDSIILNYTYAQDLQREFGVTQQSFQNNYSDRRLECDKEMANFQDKVQNGGFASQQAAILEGERISAIEREVQRLDLELTNKLSELQVKNNKTLFDSIDSVLKRYNEVAGYKYVFEGSTVLRGEEGCNITADILEVLNREYKESK